MGVEKIKGFGKNVFISCREGTTGCHVVGKLAEIVPAIEERQAKEENSLPNVENGIDTSIKARFELHPMPQIDMPFIPYEPKRIFRQHHHVKKNKRRK